MSMNTAKSCRTMKMNSVLEALVLKGWTIAWVVENGYCG
jgi:hypothetical protein